MALTSSKCPIPSLGDAGVHGARTDPLELLPDTSFLKVPFEISSLPTLSLAAPGATPQGQYPAATIEIK